MIDLFWVVLHLSLLASVAVIIAVPLRWLFRTCRLPAWLCVALWLAVLVRMLAPPGMVTSSLSLLRWSAPAIEQRVDAWAQAEPYTAPVSQPAAPQTGEITAPAAVSAAPAAPSAPTPAVISERPTIAGILAWVWAAGVVALWGYGVFSALKLHLRLRAAVRCGENETLRWECDRIPGPFVFGLVRPKIYVPVGLEENTLEWVLRHERAHLRLGHHRLKPLFFAALALHWFNPLLWLAWALFCRDLEVLCDEQVLKHNPGQKKDYSAALLSLAAPRQGFVMLPPGFGETGVKDRIERALRYRKPAARMVVIAGILAVLSICCLGAEPTSAALPEDTPAPAAQPDGEPQTDWNSSVQLWPELDMENLWIRYPGETKWTELGPLFPAPQEWAGQEVGGRNKVKNLEGLLSGTGGFVDTINGWYVVCVGQGVAHADTYVYRTHDGGRTWQETGRPDPELMFWYPSCCYFLDNQVAFIGKSHFNGTRLFRTEDGGSTWSEVEISLSSAPDGSSAWETKAIRFNGSDGLMVVRDYSSSGAGRTAILNSHDSGKTWTVLELPDAEIETVPEGAVLDDLRIGSSVEPDTWDTDALRMLGAIPENDIALYSLNEKVTGLTGIILRRGVSMNYFPEIAGPAIPLQSNLALNDYDGDGREDLAVSLTTGTGTNGPSCQLYLFPWDGVDFLAPAKPEWMDAQVDIAVQSRFHTENATMTIETAGRAWLLDFSGHADLWEVQPPDGLFSTDNYFFDLEPLRLTMYLSPGNLNRPDAVPHYMVRYSARLLYDGEQVTIDKGSGTLEALPGETLREIFPTSISLPLDASEGWQTDTLSMNDMDGTVLMYNSRSGAYALLLSHDYGGTWTRVDPPKPQPSEGTFWPDINNWFYDSVVLLGALSGADICLYCFGWSSGCNGLLLRRGDILTYLPDVPLQMPGPRIVPAQLALGDYDGDGTEELAAISCVGTGTGVSLHELLIFEESAGRFLSSASFDKGAWNDVDLHTISGVPGNAALGYILYFHAEDSQLSATLDLCNADAHYNYIGSLECTLRYDGSGIVFENITYTSVSAEDKI